MRLNRRSFLSGTAGGLAAAAAAATITPLTLQAAAAPRRPRIKLGIASYSYWHFRTTKVPIETVIEKTAALGVEGVDILHR